MSQLVPIPIATRPGVVATESLISCAGRWTLPWQWFRFRNGKPQKIGGYVQAAAAPTAGTPRATLGWTDQILNEYIAVGTYKKLYVYDIGFNQNDITPFMLTSSGVGGGAPLTNPFSTTLGSSIVKVTQPTSGVLVGDTLIYTSVGAAVGGITAVQLTGTFISNAIIDVNNFTFDCGVVATSTAGPGGGTVTYEYEIQIGSELAAGGYGWGVGPYGLGTYGTARLMTTITIEPRVWGLDNFGKILLASNGPEGSIYQFDPTQNQPWPRALLIPNAPADVVRQIVVTPEEFVFALCDGLVVNSCSQGDFTTWTPATNNTAFSRTLTIGSKLVGGKPLGPFVTLVWTDAALYAFNYTGSAFLYDSVLVGRNCGLIGPRASATVAGVAYWMGNDNFWMYSGGQVTPMPAVEDIRKYVYDQLNLVNGYQCEATYNPPNNEIWFTITVGANTNPTLLAIFHIWDQCWTLHASTLVSGTYFSAGNDSPYMWDSKDFLMYLYEQGHDANGSPIACTMTLAPSPLGGAQGGAIQAYDIEGIRTDTFQQIGNSYWTVITYDEVADTIADSTIEDTETETVPVPGGSLTDFRLAGRFIGLQIQQTDLGAYMRLGTPIALARPSAKRR